MRGVLFFSRWLNRERSAGHLEQFDIALEQFVDVGRQVHALGIGDLGQGGLHLVAQVHRQLQLRAFAVKLAAFTFAEIV